MNISSITSVNPENLRMMVFRKVSINCIYIFGLIESTPSWLTVYLCRLKQLVFILTRLIISYFLSNIVKKCGLLVFERYVYASFITV